MTTRVTEGRPLAVYLLNFLLTISLHYQEKKGVRIDKMITKGKVL